MATPTNTETNPVSTASNLPGTMSALGSPNISGLSSATTTAASGTALPDFSGMTDSQLMSYLGSGGAGTTDTGGTSSSSIGDFLSSLLGGQNIGNLAEFGALAGLGLSQADAARARTNQLAGELTSIGQPFTEAGKGILSETQTGTVDPNSPLSTSIGQQMASANTLSQIGQTALSNYQTGTLRPADQARLDQQSIAQKAQIAQQLGNAGISDSSVLDSQYQQIDTQTEINRQTLLDAQYQVGQQALQEVQQTYSNLINQSLALSGFGAGLQSQAVQLQIASDTAITAQLTQLFGAIATGYGNSVKPAGSGTGTGTGGSGTSSTIGQVTNQIGKLLNGGTSGGITAGDVLSGINTAAPAGSIMNTDLGSFSSIFGTPTAATDVAATTGVTPAFDTGFMSSGASGQAGAINYAANAGESAGATSAATELAPAAAAAAPALIPEIASFTPELATVGTEAATTMPAIAGLGEAGGAAAGGSAAGAGASGAGLGAGAGATVAFLPLAATILLAETQPTVKLDASYWKSLGDTVQAGPSDPNFYGAAFEALNMPQAEVPTQIQEMVWQSGIVPYGTWGMGDPTGGANANYNSSNANTGGRGAKRA